MTNLHDPEDYFEDIIIDHQVNPDPEKFIESVSEINLLSHQKILQQHSEISDLPSVAITRTGLKTKSESSNSSSELYDYFDGHSRCSSSPNSSSGVETLNSLDSYFNSPVSRHGYASAGPSSLASKSPLPGQVLRNAQLQVPVLAVPPQPEATKIQNLPGSFNKNVSDLEFLEKIDLAQPVKSRSDLDKLVKLRILAPKPQILGKTKGYGSNPDSQNSEKSRQQLILDKQELERQKKLLKNRISAANSKNKQKNLISGLKDKIVQLEAQLDQISRQNQILQDRLKLYWLGELGKLRNEKKYKIQDFYLQGRVPSVEIRGRG